MEPVRVAVQASDPIMQAGLTSFVRTRAELALVDPETLTEHDVLVVYVDRLTSQVAAELRDDSSISQVPKVLLADELRESDIVAVAESRVAAVLPRSKTTGARFVEAILSVAPGRGDLPADLLGRLLESIRKLQREELSDSGPGAAGLTTREIEVLRLMAEGYDTHETAEKLCYSERTVKNVIYALTNRMNLRNRPHAVAYAMRAGVL
ncbi:helix-turn-helix transcriptional regulator [Amycolatopsis sp. lyj-90]|uniref:helix-turn-helix transcriptional regulator n=1 Tax=Amycolatopsis sp. lyj-90 TaxID=2789285 RepID=UPI00397E7682